MNLQEKYSLLERIAGDGASSFRGRQIASGRDVTIHLLPGGRAANEALISRIRVLPPQYVAQLLEVCEDEGMLYLVTVAPPHRHFSEWLRDQPLAAFSETGPGNGDLTGIFQSHDPSHHNPAGEVTRLFQPGLPRIAQTPDLAHGTGAVPGEFTRLFQPQMPPNSAVQNPPPVPAAAAPDAAPPGEFTRLFPKPEPVSGATDPILPRDTGTNHGAFIADPLPQSTAPPLPGAPVPGEFTRSFGLEGYSGSASDAAGATEAFVAPDRVQPGAPVAPQGPSEYTQVISRPRPSEFLTADPLGASAGQAAPNSLPSPSPGTPHIPQLPQIPPKARTLSLLVTAILCLLSFLAGGALVFFILRQ